MVTEIIIKNNLIEIFDAETFRHLPYLRRFIISNNHFHCDCDLIGFKKWAKEEMSAHRLFLFGCRQQCYVPSKLKRKHVRVIDYKMAWIACEYHLETVIGAVCGFVIVVLCGLVICAYYYRYDIIFWWVITRVGRRASRGPG